MMGSKRESYINVLATTTSPLRLAENVKDEIARIKHRDPQELRECLDGVQLAIQTYFSTEEKLAQRRNEYYREPLEL